MSVGDCPIRRREQRSNRSASPALGRSLFFRRVSRGERRACLPLLPSSLLKNALVAFFNLAKGGAKLRPARKITTSVAILGSHPCDHAGCRIFQQPARRDPYAGASLTKKRSLVASAISAVAKTIAVT